jgi:uncharacterized protein
MPLQPRLSFITLGVHDLPRMRQFYQEVLGLPLSVKSQEGVAFFQLNGLVLALYGHADLAGDAGSAPPPPGGGRGVSLAYNVASRAEVDSLLDELAQRGAQVLKRAHDVFWGGRVAYFADPEGYVWELAWNPAGYLDAAGNFVFGA